MGKYRILKRSNRYYGSQVILKESSEYYHVVVETQKGRGKGSKKSRTIKKTSCFYAADSCYVCTVQEIQSGETVDTLEV